MADSINLVGKMMCEECDAFLGKAHKDTCSKHGRLVENADATEKFTTVEHADREEPLLGIDREGAELLVKWLGELDLDDPAEIEKCQGMIGGLTTFAVAAREVEAPEAPASICPECGGLKDEPETVIEDGEDSGDLCTHPFHDDEPS